MLLSCQALEPSLRWARALHHGINVVLKRDSDGLDYDFNVMVSSVPNDSETFHHDIIVVVSIGR